MGETRVVNLRKEKYDVYIGRPGRGVTGPWGNPFELGRDGDRATVLAKYRKWLMAHPALIERARRELRGKVLGCFCKPLACHGDVLAEIIDSEPRCRFCGNSEEALKRFPLDEYGYCRQCIEGMERTKGD